MAAGQQGEQLLQELEQRRVKHGARETAKRELLVI